MTDSTHYYYMIMSVLETALPYDHITHLFNNELDIFFYYGLYRPKIHLYKKKRLSYWH